MKYKPANVEIEKLLPIVAELVNRCGSPEQAARYAGVGTSTIYRLRHLEYRTMRRHTAQLLIGALTRKREEDRASRSVHPAMLKAKARTKRIEEKEMRL